MRRLIAGIILITLNCVVILAQQKDKLPTQPTPIAVGLLISDPPMDVVSLLFGQSQINDRKISPSSQSENQEAGGWGYSSFDQNGKPTDDAGMKMCLPCHQAVKDRDFIFTRYTP